MSFTHHHKYINSLMDDDCRCFPLEKLQSQLLSRLTLSVSISLHMFLQLTPLQQHLKDQERLDQNMIDLIEGVDRMLPSVQLVEPYVQTMPLEIAIEQIFWLMEDVSMFIVKYL